MCIRESVRVREGYHDHFYYPGLYLANTFHTYITTTPQKGPHAFVAQDVAYTSIICFFWSLTFNGMPVCVWFRWALDTVFLLITCLMPS